MGAPGSPTQYPGGDFGALASRYQSLHFSRLRAVAALIDPIDTPEAEQPFLTAEADQLRARMQEIVDENPGFFDHYVSFRLEQAAGLQNSDNT